LLQVNYLTVMDKYLLLCFCVMVIIGIVNTYDSQLMPDEFFDDGLAETARGRMASFAMVTWTVGSFLFFLVPKWYQDSQMYNEKYIGRWWRNKNLRSVVDHHWLHVGWHSLCTAVQARYELYDAVRQVSGGRKFRVQVHVHWPRSVGRHAENESVWKRRWVVVTATDQQNGRVYTEELVYDNSVTELQLRRYLYPQPLRSNAQAPTKDENNKGSFIELQRRSMLGTATSNAKKRVGWRCSRAFRGIAEQNDAELFDVHALLEKLTVQLRDNEDGPQHFFPCAK
jgi:hypothetical protein